MKFYLQIITDESLYNAGFKARRDVDATLSEAGYMPCILQKSKYSWKNNLMVLCYLYRLLSKIKKGEKLFIQYPYYLFSSKWKNTNFLKTLLSHYKGEVECLIHDIHGLREDNRFDEELTGILERCSKVIVHTPEMRRLVLKNTNLTEEQIRTLYLFDYLTDSPTVDANPSGHTVIFAGNLKKSSFIRDLHKIGQPMEFNLYGNFSDNIQESEHCHYMGKFQPNDISAINGDWGLAWDGDSIDTCHGPEGEYLRINSSHKISLYLAACKPVIIWEESSLKEFITSNHLGITVKSLHEISERINSLTSEEKQLIKTNVKQCSEKLRSGFFLKRCLQ